MLLKRLYDWEASKEEWSIREETCSKCKGVGVVVNQTKDGVDPCSNEYCEDGTQRKPVPPVSGIKVLRAGPKQNIGTRVVAGGQAEGWLSLKGDQLIIHGVDGLVVYKVLRTPGKYEDETIHYYECEQVE